MLRLLFVLMVLSLCTAVQADVIYVEDFEDYQGNAGFDPLFNYSFDLSHSQYAGWGLGYFYKFPEHGTVLGVYGDARDWITFDLTPAQAVKYASVDFWVSSSNVEPSEYNIIDFIGVDSTQRVYLYHSDCYETTSISSDEIGSITGIRICSNGENFFDNITIRVVPEPTCLFCLIVLVSGFALLFRQFRGAA